MRHACRIKLCRLCYSTVEVQPDGECAACKLAKSMADSVFTLPIKPYEQRECPVCLQEFAAFPRSVQLPCDHFIHVYCFCKQVKSQCPICKVRPPLNKEEGEYFLALGTGVLTRSTYDDDSEIANKKHDSIASVCCFSFSDYITATRTDNRECRITGSIT